MARAVTQRQVDAVMREIDRRWGSCYEGLPAESSARPKVVRNWRADWISEDGPAIPVAIVWEMGPDEWAYLFTSGGFNGELAAYAEEFLGTQKAREEASAGRFTEHPSPLPEGLHVECGNMYTLCLYPKI